MDRWQILGALCVSGFGVLTFLRIVGGELTIRNSSIELRRKRERGEKERLAEEAAQQRLQQDLERQQAGQRTLVGKGSN